MYLYDSNLVKTQKERIQTEHLLICKTYEKYFNSLPDQENSETIVIKQSQSLVFRIISNWELFKNFVPNITEEVTCFFGKDNVCEKIYLKWIKKSVQCKLKVIEIKTNDQGDFVFALELYESEPKIPLQRLTFTVKKIDEDVSFVSFKHIFLEKYEMTHLQDLISEKKKILKTLKTNLENMIHIL